MNISINKHCNNRIPRFQIAIKDSKLVKDIKLWYNYVKKSLIIYSYD